MSCVSDICLCICEVVVILVVGGKCLYEFIVDLIYVVI